MKHAGIAQRQSASRIPRPEVAGLNPAPRSIKQPRAFKPEILVVVILALLVAIAVPLAYMLVYAASILLRGVP
jgi:hypothetical protein